MKLSKGKFQAILILAIVLVAYLLLAFVIPFAKTAVFWLALVFTLAAFGVQLYVLKLSFTKGKDARSKFYGFPIARIGVVYLIVQIVLSFLFMAIAKICAAWIAAIVFVLLFAVAAGGVMHLTNTYNLVFLAATYNFFYLCVCGLVPPSAVCKHNSNGVCS